MKILIFMIILLSSCSIYHDGEGNKIPKRFVKIYVQDHFVHISTEDSIKVSQYFY